MIVSLVIIIIIIIILNLTLAQMLIKKWHTNNKSK